MSSTKLLILTFSWLMRMSAEAMDALLVALDDPLGVLVELSSESPWKATDLLTVSNLGWCLIGVMLPPIRAGFWSLTDG